MSFRIKYLNWTGFWFPLLVLVSISAIINQFNHFQVLEKLLVVVFIILLSTSFRNGIIKLVVELLSLFLFNSVVFIEVAHLYLYRSRISQSTLFILFETNQYEAHEFLLAYFNWGILLISLVLLSGILVSTISVVKKFKNRKIVENGKWSLKLFNIKLKAYHLLLLLLICTFPLTAKLAPWFWPYTIHEAYTSYRNDLIKYQQLSFDKDGGMFSNVYHANNDSNQVFVLVIGESTARSHLSLYAYSRNTNPYLSKIKDELIIYNNVISPHTHTIQSLDKTLTLASHDNPYSKFEGSTIQLFNRADFTTYWISNQKPSGFWETSVTGISNSCDEQIFINAGQQSDEAILPKLRKVLSKPVGKKFIIVHLMGTHMAYHNRYPDEFSRFQSTPATDFQHEKAYRTINTYDNAVLYNDFVLNEIVNQLKGKKANSFLLYFSDHGEDVYETIDAAMHEESYGTKPMFDIPFLLWMSESYKKENTNHVFKVSRKYMTEDLIYTLADMAQINFDEFDSTRSIINKSFEEKSRWILSDEIYDDYFKNEDE